MRTPVREEILNVAATLFYREGIRAVGVDRVIEVANVAKATLYRHFPSKDHLVAAYLDGRHHRVIRSLEDVIRSAGDPRKRVSAIFKNLHEKAGTPDFRGCAFALAVAEYGDLEQVVAIAREHKSQILKLFVVIMAEAGVARSKPAKHLALLYEGSLATVAVSRDPKAILVARDCALDVFDCAVASTRKSRRAKRNRDTLAHQRGLASGD
jgi:AcrR family transcriptional regulator